MTPGGGWALVIALLLASGVWRARGLADEPKHERDILLAFRTGFTNWAEVQAAWGLTGWTACLPSSCAPVCSWGGIECDPYEEHGGTSVTAIHLGCLGCTVQLRGRLLPGLQRLQHLSVLHLPNNGISGPLPPLWGEPGGFPGLLELDLSYNQLSGTIPDQWSIGPAFNSLFLMLLGGNQLTGPFPQTLALTNTSFTSVQQLSLADNQLSGPLPEVINGLQTLYIVALHNNRFTGTLPPGWGTQGYFLEGGYNATQALSVLSLHGNNLTGSLPDAWAGPGSFTALKELTLSGNTRLGGTLPPAWGASADAWPSLLQLNLSDCAFSGPLPAWGPNPARLAQLSVQGNVLTGSLPASWAQLPGLRQVAMQPGNAGMCTEVPPGAGFQLCQARTQAGLCEPPQDSASGPCSGGGGSGSGFPVAAVAVPVAVGGAAVLAAVFWAWRRRKGGDGKASGAAGKLDVQQPDGGSKGSCTHEDGEEGAVEEGCLPPDGVALQLAQGARLAAPLHAVVLASRDDPASSAAPAAAAAITASPWLLAGQRRQEQQEQVVRRSLGSGMPPLTGRKSGLPSEFSSSTHTGSGTGGPSSLGSPPLPSMELPPLSDWEIWPEEIQILKRPDGSDWQLGAGGFGTVFKAMRNGVQPVAVKILGTASSEALKSGPSDEEFAREISILRACRDTNILQFQGACFKGDHTLLVTEYCEGGNLAHNLRARRVSWWRRGKKIALDVARALVYLHSRRIVHLDIKSANVLLTRDGTAKVGDLGMSKILADDYVTGVVGTLAWSAPEMLWGQRCTVKADIYSFGVVLWEICTGELPLRGQLRDPAVPADCPPELLDIISRCLSPDPESRPTAVELVELLAQAPGQLPSSTASSSSALPPLPSPFAASSRGPDLSGWVGSRGASRRGSSQAGELPSPLGEAAQQKQQQQGGTLKRARSSQPSPPPEEPSDGGRGPLPQQAQQQPQGTEAEERLVQEIVAELATTAGGPPHQRRQPRKQHQQAAQRLGSAGSLASASPARQQQQEGQQQQRQEQQQKEQEGQQGQAAPQAGESASLGSPSPFWHPDQQQVQQRQQEEEVEEGQQQRQGHGPLQLRPAASLTSISPFSQPQQQDKGPDSWAGSR